MELSNLLLLGDETRILHVELLGDEIVFDLDGRYAGRFHLSNRSSHVHRVPEAVFGVHHETDVGDAGDAAAMIHHVGHVGEDAVGHAQVRYLTHRPRQDADLVLQHVGDTSRQRVEDVGRQSASWPGEHAPKLFADMGH